MYIECMSLMTPEEQQVAESLSALAFCNPFLDQRISHERAILGDGYILSQSFWSYEEDLDRKSNVDRIDERCAGLVSALRERLARTSPTPAERQLYEDVVTYFLYERYREQFLELIVHGERPERMAFFPPFQRDLADYLGTESLRGAGHLFALFYQVRRAFHYTFRFIVGRSRPAAELRAAIWESIFSHDIRRYRRTLYTKMGDVSTLISGATGTGKELVARAIGLSRYIPFEERS